MRKLVDSLVKNYRSHHGTNATLLVWVGVVGLVAFPALYMLRWTGKLPPMYDDIGFRLVATVLCLLLALRKWWPQRTRPYYLGFSYFAVFYSLAFLLPFTLLQNVAATPSVVNMVISAVLVILLTDWRNTVVMMVCGHALSIAAYWVTSPDPRLPVEFLIWWFPLCMVLVAGGSISKFVERRAELQRMRHLFSGLAGSVAHEMRGPLMQIRHVLDAMATDLPAAYRTGGNVSFTHQQVSDMLRAVGQGQDAVTRGLQAITVTLQQLNPNAFDASSFRYLSASRFVRKALNEFAYEDCNQQARVVVDEVQDFSFRGDETAFILIVFNLVKNALYYAATHPHLTVNVTIESTPTHRVVVRDTGPGIRPDKVDWLFEEFRSAGKVEGTGLGLAFCRRAMRAFGGDIACRSEPGEFTEFILSFPSIPQAQIEAHEQEVLQRAGRALAGKRVLVVDDEALARYSTRARLGTLGCDTDEAADGRDALEALRRTPYDLVLMDLHMPQASGFEATRLLRRGAVPARAHTPVLGFCASPTAVAGAQARQAGMNGILGKDCSPVEFARALEETVASAAPQLEAAATALAGKTVLLVEDNAFNRSIIKARLVEWGMQVIEAQHGQEALQALEAGASPAVILMDMEMPGLDGTETTRLIRTTMHASVKDTPVLALTGHSSPEHKAAARAAGMDGFLTKPVDPAALRSELVRVLDARKADAARPSMPAAAAPMALLNTRRINEFKRLGILDDLLPGCLGEIQRFVAHLEECLAAKDRGAAHQTLHSLLGISGEAGAQALHHTVERFYAVMTQGEWPREPDWLAQIGQLAAQTEQAMLEYCAVRCEPAGS